jgi:hypothetical protein
VAQLAGVEHRGDGIIDAEDLVVLAENLDQPSLVLGEQVKFSTRSSSRVRSQVPRSITSSDTRRGSSSRSTRFHSKKRSQSAVSEPTRLSVPLLPMSSALNQKSCGISCL